MNEWINARCRCPSLILLCVAFAERVMPYFSQEPLSYLKLPTVKNSYKAFKIKITFRPDNVDGKQLTIQNLHLNSFVFQMEQDASCSVCKLNLFSVLPRFYSLVWRSHFVLWWVLVLKSEHKNTHCNVVACRQPLVGTVEVLAAFLLLYCAQVRKQRQLYLHQRTVQRVQHGFVCRLVQAALTHLKAWWQCSSSPRMHPCFIRFIRCTAMWAPACFL